MIGGLPHRWAARLAAIVVGIAAADGVLVYGWQLLGFSGWSFLLLLGFVSLLCSLAGVLGAVGTWRFRSWGWWLAAWFCLFGILGALVPYAIFGRRLGLGLFQIGWVLALGAGLTYLLTPSVRGAYRITASLHAVLSRILGAALLCILVQFGYAAYVVVREAWFSS